MSRTFLIAILASAALATPALAAPFLPTFNASNFGPHSDSITNPYFPIVEGQSKTFTGSEGEIIVTTGAGAGPDLLGVHTAKVRDRLADGDLLIEDTFDYYAQDKAGNVWYFGEDSTSFSYDNKGQLTGTSTAGSWRAGVNGGKPGFALPTDKTIGFNYYQEFAPADGAVDEGTTKAVLPSFNGYSQVIEVLETTALEPQARDIKYYAPGVGLIFEEEDVRPNLKNPRQTFELTGTATAQPAFEFRKVPGSH